MQTLHELASQFWGVWLMILFVGICIWALWPSRQAEMDRAARIPFEDEENKGGK